MGILGKDAHKQLGDPAFNIFYNATTLIVIYGRESSPGLAADCWLAAENLMLAAWAKGLGTCVMGLAMPALNDGRVKAELGLADDLVAVAATIIGRPLEMPAPTPRKDPKIMAWRGEDERGAPIIIDPHTGTALQAHPQEA